MDDPTPETWRAVIGWEGLYEVSDLARVRSLRRMTRTGMRGGQILKPVVNDTGAHVVVLHDSGRKRYVFVYDLVAEAFIGPKPPGQEVLHGGDDRLDSTLANIRYGTRSENLIDAAVNGKHPTAKLTVADVRDIRSRVANGASRAVLAAEYGVARPTVDAVIARRNWKHVA